MSRSYQRGVCVRCGNERFIHARGLCRGCYQRAVPQSDRASKREPTMEELDALIEEQMKPENLPEWWHNSYPEPLPVLECERCPVCNGPIDCKRRRRIYCSKRCKDKASDMRLKQRGAA